MGEAKRRMEALGDQYGVAPIPCAGEVGILNVGAGDTKLTFDKKNPVERARAAKIVEDMLKRGFAILIQVGKKNGEPLYQRAKGFDPKRCEYIIAGGPDEHLDLSAPVAALTKRGRGRPIRLAAETTRAVSVGRTAGG